MDSNQIQTSFLMSSKDSQNNPESQLEKKMLNRQELFSSENNLSVMKEQAISSDLSLGNNEREKLFKTRRLKKKINIDTTSSLINKLTIPKDFYDQCSTMEVNPRQFQEFVTKLKSENDSNSQFEGLVGLRKLLALPTNPPIQEIIDFGLVSFFIALLDHPFPEFQYEALWCLTNIACGTSDQTNSIAIKGGIVKIIKLMDSSIEELLNQTIWTLGNLAGDSGRIRDQIIEHQGFDKVITVLSTTDKPQLIKQCVFTIAQFGKVKPACSYELLKRTIPFVVKGIFSFPEDVDFLVDACFFLSHLTEVHKKSIDQIIDTGVLPVLFKALEIIGNIASGNPNQTQALLDMGVLSYLKSTIFHQKKSVRKESAWIISNIAAGTQRQIETLILEGYLPICLQVISTDQPEIKKEAIWAACNLSSIEKKELMEILIKQGLIEQICQFLQMKEPKYLAVSLEALGNILEFGNKYYRENGRNLIVKRIEELGMIDVLESLQYNPVEVIYEKTIKILETYFETENTQ